MLMSAHKISVIGIGKLGSEIHSVLSQKYEVKTIDKTFPVNKFGKVDYSNLGEVAFIVVPTPSVNDKFTSEYVENVLDQITQEQIVSIISTLYPGETDRLQKKYPHLTLVYNPAFVALGSVKHDFTHPDLVLIGSNDKKATEIVWNVLKKVVLSSPKVCVMSPVEAEIAKLTLNCYITTKITFANQIGNLCYAANVSPDLILKAVGSDSRVGSKYFRAGLGYGGPCFPRDNLAMSAYMKQKGIKPALTQTVHNLNEAQADEIVKRIKKINPKTIGFKSFSYKEGTDVTECSPLLAVYDKLDKRKYTVVSGKGDITLDWNGINLSGGENDTARK